MYIYIDYLRHPTPTYPPLCLCRVGESRISMHARSYRSWAGKPNHYPTNQNQAMPLRASLSLRTAPTVPISVKRKCTPCPSHSVVIPHKPACLMLMNSHKDAVEHAKKAVLHCQKQVHRFSLVAHSACWAITPFIKPSPLGLCYPYNPSCSLPAHLCAYTTIHLTSSFRANPVMKMKPRRWVASLRSNVSFSVTWLPF